MPTHPNPDLLQDIQEVDIPTYPSMKQAWLVALVLFLLSNAIHFSFYYLSGYIPFELIYTTYLLDVTLPLLLITSYLVVHRQKAHGPGMGLSLYIPRGNNLWMLLVIVPALYFQLIFLRFFIGELSFTWDGRWHMIHKKIMYCLVFVLLIPAMQEFVFRGVILNGLLKRYPPTTSVVTASLIAVTPYIYPTSMLLYLPVTAFLSWLYYRSRSLVFTFLSNALLGIIPFALNFRRTENTISARAIAEGTDATTWLAVAVLVFWVGIIFFNKDILDSNDNLK
ncbi:CPBP family glutamic-type intramembrane protease [Chitinophaga sp. OAE865]|uniref:CPBP family glutamic-type intramembrane protease n=1 Tax=Chitinophaga sp. OAE865 TaxID=2817898 RepID=UPI001AEB354C